MLVLVTGGAGFIGSSLVDRLLSDDLSVAVVDDFSTGLSANLSDARRRFGDRLTIHEADICSAGVADLVARLRPDTVFHLAAQTSVPRSVAQPGLDATINVLGSLNVIEASAR